MKIHDGFGEYELKDRMHMLAAREATNEELCLVHSWRHVNFIRKTSNGKNLRELSEAFNSIYLHEMTDRCAKLAAGSTLNVVDHVLKGDYQKGICVVRPPGHHAEENHPHGFCIFNNIALAAQFALHNHKLKRYALVRRSPALRLKFSNWHFLSGSVLIVDWDIHHGNGTQRMFLNSKNVLYISLHRYDHGEFFPKKSDANYDVVGNGRGEGFNVNIPWNKVSRSRLLLALKYV